MTVRGVLTGLLPLALLFACGTGGDETNAPADAGAGTANGAAPLRAGNEAEAAPAAAPPAARSLRWRLQSSGEGAALALLTPSGGTAMRLFCAAGQRRLLVNVPAFRPIGSEERLSFGGAGEAEALVADTRGDRERGGVSGTGAVPASLPAMLSGPVSASYGAQTSGPHPAVPDDLARAFSASCNEAPGTQPPRPAPPEAPLAPATPCHMQGSESLRVTPLRAVGTEPFWAARIEGRCVTYSHPEDQAGTRVWTRYAPGTGGGGTWTGSLDGRPFALTVRPQAGCSDGMSDRVYPLAATLTVGGEQRTGCAAPN
jgi:uncharacterized membrane protein